MASSINVKIAPLPRGAYSSSATYAKLDVVSYNGSSYMAIKAVPTGTAPTNTTYWQLLVQKPTLDDGDVTTAKISNGAVTEEKIADEAVSMDKLSDDIVDMLYASFPVDNAKGSIASFEDGADNVPVRQLKLNLEPYQNLNGYANPWVGGAGINKFNSKGLSSYSNNGITVTESNGTLTFNGTATANAYFAMNGLGLAQGNYMFAVHNASANSNVHVSFQHLDDSYFGDNALNAASKIIALTNVDVGSIVIYVTSGTTLSNFTMFPQLESGTTATAWSPYENICPIYPANGKNLLENVVTDDVKTIGGITYTRLSDGSVIANGTATSASFYCPDVSTASATPVTDHNMFLDAYMGKTLIVTGTPSDVGSANIRIMIGRQAGSSLANDIGQGATFTVSEAGLWVGIRIESGTTVNNAHFYPMIRHAEITDASYVPYNAIGITRTGKNLIDLSNVIIGKAWNNDTNSARAVVYAECRPNTTYTVNLTGGSFDGVYWIERQDKSATTGYLSSIGSFPYTVTTNSNSWVMGLQFNKTSVSTSDFASVSLQIEVGSQATEYEPYTADRYYIDSSTPIYGGTLEVETGVLTVTHQFVDLGSLSWTKSSPRFYSSFSTSAINCPKAPSSDTSYIANAICSQYSVTSRYNVENVDGSFSIHNAGATTYITIHDSSLTSGDATAFKTAMNGVQLVYELATPLVYQLTPVQVKTLLGYNNIWTDSGTVEVQYLANIGLYIQKIIGATEDDMVANQNISANKYFFVGEELFYSTTAIASGASIVVGTNCIKTNLADALNALNT